jgi:hypothetical protein
MYLAYANRIGLMMAHQWAKTCRHLRLNVMYLLVVIGRLYLLIFEFYIKIRGVYTVVLVINIGNNCSVKTQLISLLDYVLSNIINSNTITVIV